MKIALTAEAQGFLEGLFGIIRAGAVVVPIPARVNATQIGKLLDDCKPMLLLTDAPYSPAAGLQNITMDQIKEVGARHPAFRSSEDNPGNDISVVYSSGTTTAPKGVIHTMAARQCAALRDAEFFGMNEQTVTLVSTPLESSMSWSTLLPTVMVGGTSVVMSGFDAGECFEILKTESPTVAKLVPTQCMMLLNDPKFSPRLFECLEILIYGGAKANIPLKKTMRETFPKIATEVYGSSEAGPISCLRAYEPAEKIGSVGCPLPGVAVLAVDENGEQVPHGVTGELAVTSPSLMRGYLNSAGDVLSHSPDGPIRLRTGDIGQVDADGYVWLDARKNDVIISAGFNIHVADIEEVLARHRNVKEAAVVGCPNDVLGETPVAFVVLQNAGLCNAHDICKWANSQLNRNQKLAEVRLVDKLPLTATGKVSRLMLKQELERNGF